MGFIYGVSIINFCWGDKVLYREFILCECACFVRGYQCTGTQSFYGSKLTLRLDMDREAEVSATVIATGKPSGIVETAKATEKSKRA